MKLKTVVVYEQGQRLTLGGVHECSRPTRITTNEDSNMLELAVNQIVKVIKTGILILLYSVTDTHWFDK